MELRGCGARVAAASEPNEGSNAQNFAILGKAATRKTPLVFVRESKRPGVVTAHIRLAGAIEEAQLFNDVSPREGPPHRRLARRRRRSWQGLGYCGHPLQKRWGRFGSLVSAVHLNGCRHAGHQGNCGSRCQPEGTQRGRFRKPRKACLGKAQGFARPRHQAGADDFRFFDNYAFVFELRLHV